MSLYVHSRFEVYRWPDCRACEKAFGRCSSLFLSRLEVYRSPGCQAYFAPLAPAGLLPLRCSVLSRCEVYRSPGCENETWACCFPGCKNLSFPSTSPKRSEVYTGGSAGPDGNVRLRPSLTAPAVRALQTAGSLPIIFFARAVSATPCVVRKRWQKPVARIHRGLCRQGSSGRICTCAAKLLGGLRFTLGGRPGLTAPAGFGRA